MTTIRYIEHEGIIHVGGDQKPPNAFWAYGDGTKKLCNTRIIGNYTCGEIPLSEIAFATNLCPLCKEAWNDETIGEYVTQEEKEK